MSGEKNKIINLIKKLPALILAGFLFVFSNAILVDAKVLPKTDSRLTIFAMDKTYEFYYPEIDFFQGGLYLKNAEQIVDGIYYDTIIKPIDAKAVFNLESENPISFEREIYGRAIDKQDLVVKIEKALLNGVSEVKAKEVVISPKYTVEKLEKSTYRRSFFTTCYHYSSSERKQNIALCARLIGGRAIEPYEQFSFNEVVGERTEERGFLNAKIIENGKFTDGVGGGVCQVSSTLYNAVLLGGLKVVERHPHSMLVSYVEPSFDAMVSSGYADFKFVNDSDSVVFITATATDNSITISVYGTKTEFTYERESVVTEKIAPLDFERIESDLIEYGQEKISVFPKDGAKSEGYLKIFKNGALQSKIKLSSDKYKPLQGTILYGKQTDDDSKTSL